MKNCYEGKFLPVSGFAVGFVICLYIVLLSVVQSGVASKSEVLTQSVTPKPSPNTVRYSETELPSDFILLKQDNRFEELTRIVEDASGDVGIILDTYKRDLPNVPVEALKTKVIMQPVSTLREIIPKTALAILLGEFLANLEDERFEDAGRTWDAIDALLTCACSATRISSPSSCLFLLGGVVQVLHNISLPRTLLIEVIKTLREIESGDAFSKLLIYDQAIHILRSDTSNTLVFRDQFTNATGNWILPLWYRALGPLAVEYDKFVALAMIENIGNVVGSTSLDGLKEHFQPEIGYTKPSLIALLYSGGAWRGLVNFSSIRNHIRLAMVELIQREYSTTYSSCVLFEEDFKEYAQTYGLDPGVLFIDAVTGEHVPYCSSVKK